MEKEVRSLNIPALVEERSDGQSIVGYAIVYDKDSEDMGFIERIAPGASKNALLRSDIRGLKNHDPNLIFARQGVNLELVEDRHGLRYVATPIDTSTFRAVAEEVKAGLLTGQSFGFTVAKDEWRDLESGKPTRTITEINEIFDIGPVVYPAYPDTSVALRSLDAAKSKIKDPVVTVTTLGGGRIDIGEVRSELCPTTDDSDNTEPGQTTIKVSNSTEGEEVLERISKKLQEYGK